MRKLLVICAAIFAIATSCTPVVKSTYYIECNDASANFYSNMYLKMVVASEISYDMSNLKNVFLGEEKEAIAWFDQKCAKLESDEVYRGCDVPILEDTYATFALVGYVPDGGTTTVKSKTITFKPKSISIPE